MSVLVDSDEKHKPSLKILRTCQENVDLLFQQILGLDLEKVVEEIESLGWKPEGEACVTDTFA